MLHSSGNNHANGDMIEINFFRWSFWRNYFILSGFFFFGIFDLKYHCYFYHYSCLNGHTKEYDLKDSYVYYVKTMDIDMVNTQLLFQFLRNF